MSEYELLDLIAGLGEFAMAQLTIYFTTLTANVFVAYITGERLTR